MFIKQASSLRKNRDAQSVVVVDVNNLNNGGKPVKLQKENPAGCAGEGKQIKGK